MRRSERELDALIREALGHQDAEMFDDLGELPISEQMIQSFQGTNSWLSVLTFVLTLVIFSVAVWASVGFFQATDTIAAVKWGISALYLHMAVLGLKIWWWGELGRRSTQREIKRMELHVAQLGRDLLAREES